MKKRTKGFDYTHNSGTLKEAIVESLKIRTFTEVNFKPVYSKITTELYM